MCNAHGSFFSVFKNNRSYSHNLFIINMFMICVKFVKIKEYSRTQGHAQKDGLAWVVGLRKIASLWNYSLQGE